MPIATAAQTIGPYWHLIEYPEFADLTRFGAEGEKVVLTGLVIDGDGAPVTDGCIELWQASPAAGARFPGYGRSATDADGRFRFTTVKPGPVPGRGNTLQAPHFAINILARGILTRLYTRAYFEDEKLNGTDPLLTAIDDPARRATLLARPDGPGIWRMDIRLQGDGETVFIEV
ncbi:protocatechuate 3,4-dioxygenase subunit alpha [Limobrevibacterium gyesilva]|uniref:Protocatechuate 3,4-dioxygenase subunit alpha n=1 Tax=Limobrevibacterium gyesilva TaxID=2991712 RepID=A0AA41YJC5_9PROT|nr:protocatechuate 3,4-dioxygenase subunit alpha [Limobrevibacterium gyesilva]MCW3474249.1 protocatechuate 3,4-dioxygenase subunit alpha [Limobrevibacterium gyesilva]